jgi:hypothetical protein
VVDPRGEDEEVALGHGDSDPALGVGVGGVGKGFDVEESWATQWREKGREKGTEKKKGGGRKSYSVR